LGRALRLSSAPKAERAIAEPSETAPQPHPTVSGSGGVQVRLICSCWTSEERPFVAWSASGMTPDWFQAGVHATSPVTGSSERPGGRGAPSVLESDQERGPVPDAVGVYTKGVPQVAVASAAGG